MNAHERAASIIKDILVNHLPRVVDGLQKGYVDENQILVIYDHAVRARILTEQSDADKTATLRAALVIADRNLDDIDTAGDMFKPEQTPYFKYVAAKCRDNVAVWRAALEATK